MNSPIGIGVRAKGIALALGKVFGRFSPLPPQPSKLTPRIGVALGGGFARGVAHIGVLRVLERNNIPIHCIAGVSAGSIIAAAYASGTPLDELERLARSMRFKDVAGWSLNFLGLASSDRMEIFLDRALRARRFEELKMRLAIVATDLRNGEAVVFKDHGDVKHPVRASCSYPGLFQPVRHNGHFLVDGAVSMDLPALPLKEMGATHTIAITLPTPVIVDDPTNMLAVINRSFQILQKRTEYEWRQHSDLIIAPDVGAVAWDGFDKADEMIAAGEKAAEDALPKIKLWLG